MSGEAIHNPDQYISDLRLVLSQGKKKIALLVGAGAPAAIKVDGKPLIPMIRQLTTEVLGKLSPENKKTVDEVAKSLGSDPTIEDILSKLRLLARALGTQSIFGASGNDFEKIADDICDHIGKRVNVRLPHEANPYSHLVSWISGTARRHGVEVFTPNYDLLMEEALERAHVSYFDGFSGGVRPFFDAATVSNDELPSRWARLWKMHGSLGWAIEDGEVIRTQSRSATHLIYPDHLKYDHTQKQPYAALFDRLRAFLRTPDALLIVCGFSFADAHIVSAIEESLAAYPLAAIVALQYRIRIPQGYQSLYGIVADTGASAIPKPFADDPSVSGRWITVQLLGEALVGTFERGISQHPSVGDEVHLVTERDLLNIYGKTSEGQVRFGSLSSAENISVFLDVDKLVTRHCALVGSTGSGKSTTVAALLRTLCASENHPYPSARILILDIHGEYSKALSDVGCVFNTDPDGSKNEKGLFVPFWALELDDLLNFLFGTLSETQRVTISDKVLALKRESLASGKYSGLAEQTLTDLLPEIALTLR